MGWHEQYLCRHLRFLDEHNKKLSETLVILGLICRQTKEREAMIGGLRAKLAEAERIMQIHAGDVCSMTNENNRFAADKYEAEERADKLEAENKRLKGRIINLEKDRTGYKRDRAKYLKMLNDKKICPNCGTVDAACDCPFG